MPGSCLPSLITILVCLTTSAWAGSVEQAAPVITNSKELKDSIYTKLRLPGGGACVRLLNRNGVLGCATPSSAPVIGPLLAVTATTAADEMPQGSVAVVSAKDAGKFLQRCATETETLQKAIVGVLIQHSSEFPGWNEAPAAPYALYAVDEMDRNYPWNPAGLDIASISFPFPIYQLDNETSANARQRVNYNCEQRDGGSSGGGSGGGIDGESTAVNVARMELTMEATGNSSSCIAAKTCYPLGGYSVWAALPPLPPPQQPPQKTENQIQLPTLLVIAQIDSTSLFHSLTQAADSPLSGLVAMLAAAQVLGSAENSEIVLQRYKKRIIFLAIMGEPWDFMGSRRLLWEIENGNSAVQGLDLDSIEGIIEIGQVGRARINKNPSTLGAINTEENKNNNTNSGNVALSEFSTLRSTTTTPSQYQLYGHIEKSGVSGRAAAPFLTTLQNIVALDSFNSTSSSNTIVLSNASSATPGLPPCSASSFLRQRPEIPVVVIEEFDASFINNAYHSQYDTTGTDNNDTDIGDLQNGEERFDQNGITATAIFLGQALNTLAQSDSIASLQSTNSSSTNATSDVLPVQMNTTAIGETVDALLGCLGKESPGMGCPLVNALMTPWTSSPAGHYIGILRTVTQNPSLPDPNVQTDVERFIWNFLAVFIATNITSTQSSSTPAEGQFTFPWCSPKNASTACPPGTVCAGWRDIQGSSGSGRCLNSTVKFVPSYSTLLECVGCNGTATDDGTFRWNVTGTGTDSAASAWALEYNWPEDPIWVESNWPMSTPSLEMFLKESSSVDFAVLGAGLAVMVVSVGVGVAVQLAWNKRMKQD